MVVELQSVHLIHETAFNMSGFIQPSFVDKMLLSDNAHGLNDTNSSSMRCVPQQPKTTSSSKHVILEEHPQCYRARAKL